MSIIRNHVLNTKAVYSDDKKYRYSLNKTWDENKPKATFIGINPSDATELLMDKTVMNLMNHLIKLGYGKVEIVNLYAFRSKKQEGLKYRCNKQEESNNEYVGKALSDSELIIIGWRRDADGKPKYRETIKDIKSKLKPFKEKVKCFKDKKGNINCHLSVGYSDEWSLVDYPLN